MCPHRKIYKQCRPKLSMTYTEIREINERKYYYRVASVRKGKRVSKKRIYLGKNLPQNELSLNELEADKVLNIGKNKKNLKEVNRLIPKIIAVLKKYKIKRAGLFGSYVKGKYNEKSDVDILVEINNKKMSLFDFIHIKNELQDSLGKEVDLIEYKLIRPELKKRILNEEVRFMQ